MHALEIKGGNLYLDGHLLQGVTGYKLEESVNDSANLTVALYVKDVSVSPSCCNSPEVISPLSALENIGPSYYGVSVKCTEASFLEKLQEIVREEIAAHDEWLKEESFAHVGKRLAEQNRAIGIQGFCDTPEQP